MSKQKWQSILNYCIIDKIVADKGSFEQTIVSRFIRKRSIYLKKLTIATNKDKCLFEKNVDFDSIYNRQQLTKKYTKLPNKYIYHNKNKWKN